MQRALAALQPHASHAQTRAVGQHDVPVHPLRVRLDRERTIEGNRGYVSQRHFRDLLARLDVTALFFVQRGDGPLNAVAAAQDRHIGFVLRRLKLTQQTGPFVAAGRSSQPDDRDGCQRRVGGAGFELHRQARSELEPIARHFQIGLLRKRYAVAVGEHDLRGGRVGG